MDCYGSTIYNSRAKCHSGAISMTLAQWILIVLQFLTLLIMFWYTWETHKAGVRLQTQQDREWAPQCHYSIDGLDPTTGTGEIRPSHTSRAIEPEAS